MSKQELIPRYEKNFGKSETQRLLNVSKNIINDKYIRINISKTNRGVVKRFLKNNRVKYSNTIFDNCIKIDKSFFNLSSSLHSLIGDMYMQDVASQIPVNCVEFDKLPKKVKILDMCAAPGSKTTQLADVLEFHKIKYKITALEPEVKRLTKLANNIQKQGFQNIEIINCRGEDYNSEEKFDLILLDAPCSGNLAGDRDWLNRRDVKGIVKMSEIQKKLLKKASELVKKGGIVIYSTCSIEKEENEDNVEWVLKNSNLNAYLPKLKVDFDTKPLVKQNSMRFMPNKSGFQGFFICLLELH